MVVVVVMTMMTAHGTQHLPQTGSCLAPFHTLYLHLTPPQPQHRSCVTRWIAGDNQGRGGSEICPSECSQEMEEPGTAHTESVILKASVCRYVLGLSPMDSPRGPVACDHLLDRCVTPATWKTCDAAGEGRFNKNRSFSPRCQAPG